MKARVGSGKTLRKPVKKHELLLSILESLVIMELIIMELIKRQKKTEMLRMDPIEKMKKVLMNPRLIMLKQSSHNLHRC